MNNPLKSVIASLGVCLLKTKGLIESRSLPAFANRPKNLKIALPRNIANPDLIVLGDNVNFGPGCFLLALTEYPTAKMQSFREMHPVQSFTPVLKIGNNVSATANVQISAVNSITIEDDVMFSSNIFVADHLHGFHSMHTAFKYQDLQKIEPIVIRHGCWIEQNSIILPGVEIGEMSIIGANSLVNTSIPPRSMAYGSPARVTRRWDENTAAWCSV